MYSSVSGMPVNLTHKQHPHTVVIDNKRCFCWPTGGYYLLQKQYGAEKGYYG